MKSKERISEIARNATIAALKILDRKFPGKNKGGIGDDIAFGIHNFIESKLTALNDKRERFISESLRA